MSTLEELLPNTAVRGILPDSLVTVVSVQWFGSEALELTYKTASGSLANELIYRDDEPRVEVVEKGRPWSFDGDGASIEDVSALLGHRSIATTATYLARMEGEEDEGWEAVATALGVS
jgi:hypothetical protein